jgi:endonuclease YncB( thermonuclease family)
VRILKEECYSKGEIMELYWYKCELVRCIDGDTVEIWVDFGFHHRWKIGVRLFGLNAPEIVGANSAAGKAAKAYLEQLLNAPGLVLHSVKDRADKYGGRWLGEFYRDGVNLNQKMIEDGHAVPWDGQGTKPVPEQV